MSIKRRSFSHTERLQLQQEIKQHTEKYFCGRPVNNSGSTEVAIWEDMLIIRREGFLTESEIEVIQTPAGKEVVRAARLQIAKQHATDNAPYFEEKLQARILHQHFDFEPKIDLWIHVVVFDRTFMR